MNLNNLTSPRNMLEILRDAGWRTAVALPGLVHCTASEDLDTGYLYLRWKRSAHVEAQIMIDIDTPVLRTQPGYRRGDPEIHALVSAVRVVVSVTQSPCSPTVAIAQSTLHHCVAEIACMLEALAQDHTVGVLDKEPCNG